MSSFTLSKRDFIFFIIYKFFKADMLMMKMMSSDEGSVLMMMAMC